MASESEFEKELVGAINKCSMENGSNTPDFILARFLKACLFSFNAASRSREKWYGKELSIGSNRDPSDKALEIAARVWCDFEMKSFVMDAQAAHNIAVIIDAVIQGQSPPMPDPQGQP